MASPAPAAPAAEGEGVEVTSAAVSEGFAELERQQQLIASCTRLYHQLSEHFSALERRLSARSDMLRSKRRLLEARTSRGLDSLRRRELSIDDSVSLAVSHVHSLSSGPLEVTTCSNASDLVAGLNSLCLKMDSSAFLAFVLSRRKEVDALRAEMPSALKCCIDPAKFVMDAISEVFPVDKRAVKSPSDMAWACVVVLEAVVPALADPDTEIGAARPLVPRAARERARGIAMEWKEEVEKKGGVESAKPPDAHAFLQHVATFAVAEKEDRKLYRKIVVSFSWRRQMPRLALMLGLEDEMDDIIEELITKGQHLDAVNFACESGLQDKFPPVPLLKSYLEDSKRTSSTSDNLSTGSGQSGINANKKEQSALRAVIKCIEDRKLEAGFPLEDLQRQLEELEKAKAEKKKATSSSSSGGSTGPANKRIRVSNGGPTPPAKAGRLTSNACVSSSQAATMFVRSPSSHASYGTASSYAYDKPAGHGLYCSQSPVAIREPYAYPTEQVVSVGFGMSYPTPPMSYPAYGGYNNGLGGYGNGMAPVLHQAYYR